MVDRLLEVDVAHANENWEEARRKIDAALDECLLKNFKGMKIIHGRGNRAGHTCIIARQAVPYMEKLSREHGGKLVKDKHNNGAHIIYFN